MVAAPGVQVESELLGAYPSLVALDEVGRGAAAGPVSVGAVWIGPEQLKGPPAVRDSKLLSAAARTRLAPEVRRWARGCAVGHAAAFEVDRVGVTVALQMAGLRALAQLPPAAVVLLDGDRDWLSVPLSGAALPLLGPCGPTDPERPLSGVPVVVRVRADRDCVSVAAASIVAKVARDAALCDLDAAIPGYGFASHKGYLTAAHADAITRMGLSREHRCTWRLTASR